MMFKKKDKLSCTGFLGGVNAKRISFICLGLMVTLLAGCGAQKEQVSRVENQTAITFSWWGNDPRHLYTMDGIEAFEAQNEEIDVKYKYGVWNGYEKRNKVYMSSHTEADVMQINYGWLDTYSPTGDGYYNLYELKDLIDLSQFEKEDMAFGEVDGKLNALPIAFNTPTIFYNKDIYEKYGLQLPKDWENLFDAAKVMREDGVYPIGMAKKHAFLFLLAYFEQTRDKKFFKENGKINLTTEDIEYFLTFYKRLLDEKVMIPIEEFDRALLSDGTLAGSMFWISDINNYCGSMEAEGGHATLGAYIGVDSAKKMTGWYIKPATMYAISKYTEHPMEAAKLLDYLINSPDMAMLQQMEKGIPVSERALNTLVENDILTGSSFEANQKMLDEREKMDVMLPAMEDEAIIDIFKASMDAYAYVKVSEQEAASTILDQIRSYQK